MQPAIPELETTPVASAQITVAMHPRIAPEMLKRSFSGCIHPAAEPLMLATSNRFRSVLTAKSTSPHPSTVTEPSPICRPATLTLPPISSDQGEPYESV